ncbi:MAG: GNAT family N-acetyltransferase [Gemmatimonadota bacterium]|nr:GNAT family N-acetyltransferase [Gemmatimonadota bacterium]
MALEIRRDDEEGRFVAPTEHGAATLDYSKIDEDTLDYESTFVPPEDREQGIGEELVLHALDWAEENGWRIVPSCPFVKRVVERNPGRGEVVARR